MDTMFLQQYWDEDTTQEMEDANKVAYDRVTVNSVAPDTLPVREDYYRNITGIPSSAHGDLPVDSAALIKNTQRRQGKK